MTSSVVKSSSAFSGFILGAIVASAPGLAGCVQPKAPVAERDDAVEGPAAPAARVAPAGHAEHVTASAAAHAPPAVSADAPAASPIKGKASSAPKDEPRVWAVSAEAGGLAKIYDKPSRDGNIIGAFRAGQGVRIRQTGESFPITSDKIWKCTEGWFAVEPRGYTCVGFTSTRDAEDPRVAVAAEVLPDLGADYPYRYGTSVGAPFYRRIPTAEEQRQAEPDLDQYLGSLPPPDPKDGAVDLRPAGVGPSAALLRYLDHAQAPLVDPDLTAYEGFKIAWAREFDAHGRTWLLTPDLRIVPKDRVRQREMPTLAGVDLRAHPEMALPLAFTWTTDTPRYRRNEAGEIEATTEVIPRHTFLPATAKVVPRRGEWGQAGGGSGLFWELRDGSFLKYQDATMIKEPEARPADVGPSERWVQARITWGYLLAMDGDTPAYVSAMSPGADGIRSAGHSTKAGKHVIGWKLLASDMSGREGGKDWFVDEVPWAQYYFGNFAVHGAWWHNDFGRPYSHGCVNLPPNAARFLFGWMEPLMPQDWFAVTSVYPRTKGTVVQITH
ncbi:MAG: L,D-transpeptidase [Myxococcales bacterium]|nr:L,D-transpeptidase [Myxococcales bacterium]